MPFRPALLAGTILLAGCGAAPTDAAAQNTASEMSDEEFDRRLRDALMRNPQLIIEAIEAYRSDLEAQAAQATEDAVRNALPSLVAGDSGVAIGASAEDADIVIVEFFDYHCGFCRRALDEVLSIVDAKDANIRVVFQELPSLRAESRDASLAALAAAELGEAEYRRAHAALMRYSGLLDERAIDRVMSNAGVKERALERVREEAGDRLEAKLLASMDMGQKLGIAGTPFFIIYNPQTSAVELLEGYQAGSIEAAVATVAG